MGQVYAFVQPGQLSQLETALAGLSEIELCALIKTTHLGPRVPRSIFEWIEFVCDWELDRRAGLDYPLTPVYDVMPANESAMSLNAAKLLRLRYGPQSLAERSLFEAVFDLVENGDGGHSRRA